MAAPSTRGTRLRLLLVLTLICPHQADSRPDTLQHRATENPAGSIEDSSVGAGVLGRGPPPVTELGAGFGHLLSPGLYPAPKGTELNRKRRGKVQKNTAADTTPNGVPFPKQDILDTSAGQVKSYKSRAVRSFENFQKCFPDFSADVNSPYDEKGKFFKLGLQNCNFGLPREAKIESAHIVHKHSPEACTQVGSLDKEVTGLPCAKCQDQELILEIKYKLYGGLRNIRIELVDKGGQRKEACSISLTPWATIIIPSVLAVLILGVCITWATGKHHTVKDWVVSRWNTTRQRWNTTRQRWNTTRQRWNTTRLIWVAEAEGGAGADSGDTGGSGESEGGAGRAGAAEAGKAGGVGSGASGTGGSGTGAGGRSRNQRRRLCNAINQL